MDSSMDNIVSVPKSRVVVGMSGGVDSFAAAKVLADAGHDVVGLTIKLHQYADDDAGGCCTFNDIRDASLCCERLGIEHHVVPMLKPFKENVIDKFLDAERSGVHVNPCIGCNSNIKFPFFYQAAKALKADKVATGHYVRNVILPDRSHAPGIGATKDQSYFLWDVNRSILANTLFPLGDVSSKDQVRELVKDVFARVASKKDSTDLCFLNGKSRKEYLSEYGIVSAPAIGQRVAGKYYLGVIGSDEGFAASSDDPRLWSDKLMFGDDGLKVHCTQSLFDQLMESGDVYAVTRSSGTAAGVAVVGYDDLTRTLTLATQCKRTSPGQAVVLYSRKYAAVLGGGTILSN